MAWVVGALMLAWPPLADGHAKTYAGGTGDHALITFGSCSANRGPLGINGLGGACFGPGHVVANESGQARLIILDEVFDAVSGVACQDFDFDGRCGELGEFAEPYCASVTLGDDDTWDPTRTLLVFVHGPQRGAVQASPCPAPAFGTTGWVFHEP